MLKRHILAIFLMSWPSWVFAQTYSTSFPLAENPISERGKWVGGQSADGNLWGNVQSSAGMAYGVSEPTKYGDPTAILTGSWAADHRAQVTVKIDKTPTVCCHEIEVRLHVTISPKKNWLQELLQHRAREQILPHRAMEWAQRSLLQYRAICAEHQPRKPGRACVEGISAGTFTNW